MPISQDYQFDFRGVTFGDGTNYDVISMEGIHDIIIRDRDRDNVRSHGIIPGMHRSTFRLIRCNLEVRGTAGSSALWDDTQAIVTAMSPDQFELPDETQDQFGFRFPNEGENFVYARPIRRSLPRRNDTEFGLQPFRFEMKVYDPRIYDATLSTSGVQTTTFNVTNGGDAVTFPILEFDPDSNGDAELTNNTNGDNIEFDNVGASDALFWDGGRWVRGRADLLIAYRGTTNHYDGLVAPRGPFRLDPGVNNLTLNTGDDVVVTWHDTWM